MAQRDSRSPIEDSMDLLRLLEYPQLHGKTYLDHAGTTVSVILCFCGLLPIDTNISSLGRNHS